MYLSLMDHLDIYNKFLDKKIFSIKDPVDLDDVAPKVKVKFKIIGTKDYIVVGDPIDHLLYEITVFTSGYSDKIFSWVMGDKNVIYPTTTSNELRGFRQKCDVVLKDFLSYLGNQKPVMCKKIERIPESEINESIIMESKHDKLVSNISDEIMGELEKFNSSKLKEIQIDLPYEGYYETPDFHGEVTDFYVELYFFKTKSSFYKIDADAPGSIEDDYIRVAIYYNPDLFLEQFSEIENNLIYTLRHEYEHLLQVITNYEKVEYKSDHKYKVDSLKTLMKKREIDPQVRGYFLQSKREKLPYDVVIKNHLSKLESNRQINFLSPLRKEILIKTLIDHAKKLKLPITVSKR